LVGWLMPARADRRLFGCANYVVQILGSLAFLFAAGDTIPLLLLGVFYSVRESATPRRCRQ
jgi:hypothetical protein